MSENEVIDILSSISIGTVIAWVVVIVMIVSAVGAFFIKMYKMFEKTHKLKEENDEFKTMVKQHEEKLLEIGNQLVKIQETLDKQDEATLKSMRHTIVKSCEEAIVRGNITIREYRCIHELYDEYHNERHGNGYVTSLIEKLNKNVDIIGRLDENGKDINIDDEN